MSGFDGHCVGSQIPAYGKQEEERWEQRLGQEVEMSSVMGTVSLPSLQDFPLERLKRESLEYC